LNCRDPRREPFSPHRSPNFINFPGFSHLILFYCLLVPPKPPRLLPHHLKWMLGRPDDSDNFLMGPFRRSAQTSPLPPPPFEIACRIARTGDFRAPDPNLSISAPAADDPVPNLRDDIAQADLPSPRIGRWSQSRDPPACSANSAAIFGTLGAIPILPAAAEDAY